ncbi:hypothetical protein [Butyricicoccus pullicaecorum]|uniref:Chitin-binding type-3 domain-containing protein n=1 Tax=Butyricicoccus pullicaecorum 1.2 TaxID=1203606 RepID=R8W3Y4_9FIRM|nr:hypothetical protein [Butyricicoccus pullicaecorum]EOQ39650.1 hypothetical protein HMPREF1526_00344 [Butyricicoccus pullicaecorum 1.2]SKA56904.1 hypothetical protein SAMN02745978_01048 [Butyricicoccus pullicaecorum DSM 23266]
MALWYDDKKQTRPPTQGGGTDPALERRVETLETTSGEQQADIDSMTSVMQQTAPQQLAAFARVMAVQAAPTMTDSQALTMPDLFPTWEQVLEEAQPLKKDAIINDGGTLYRVVQDNTTPQEGQPPHGEGVLAVYRPIDQSHAGTAEDPVPWIYGMDCHEGTYYSYNGKTYLCKSDMLPCVWAPDTAGLWQWEVQEG